MEKRFARNAMWFTILFLFMLIFAVVAFFYGMDIGSKRVEQKYAFLPKFGSSENITYHQQDLVSFYHTVFTPHREFQNEWIKATSKISSGEVTNTSSLFKELESLAAKKAKEAATYNLQHSLELGTAQQNIIRSLNLFETASKEINKQSSNSSAIDLLNDIEQNEAYKTAVSQLLEGQQLYYNTMYKWAQTVNIELPTQYPADLTLSIETWGNLPLIIKNTMIAEHLSNSKQLVEFYPHDLTSRIDLFIADGQAKQMNLSTVQGIVELLTNTGAVRSGDYLVNRTRLYDDELLPQIPFFYPSPN